MSEDALAMEERRVREGEARIAWQEEILAELNRAGHSSAAEAARELLTTMQHTLQLSQDRAE